MANTTNFGWETPDDTDLVKDGAAAMRTLGNAIDASLVDLKGGTTGQVLSKNSNTDMDFVWVTSDDANAIQNAIVDAKGDLITATAADTPARLAVGNNGETLVADSSSTTGLRWQGNYSAGKNKIINGDFGIWQRGTSFTNLNDTYGADRFKHYITASAPSTYSITQQTFTAGTAPVAGYEGTYFLRQTAPTSGTITEIDMAQVIEDVRTFAGQTITFSFWAKSSANLTLKSLVQQRFGSGGSANVNIGTAQSNSVTTSWQRFTHTMTVPSIAGKTIGSGSGMWVFIFAETIATSQTIDTWGWQVEAGNTATAFQTATGTLAGELQAAQRYFYRFGGEDVYNQFCPVYFPTTSTGYGVIQFPTTMRVAPSVTATPTNFAFLYGNNSITACSGNNYTDRITKINFRFNNSVAGTPLTAGNAGVLISNNTTSGFFDISAEL